MGITRESKLKRQAVEVTEWVGRKTWDGGANMSQQTGEGQRADATYLTAPAPSGPEICPHCGETKSLDLLSLDY
jgi:hypothetical protein